MTNNFANKCFGLYVPTLRYGKPNNYQLRRVLGYGSDTLEYQRSQNGYPPFYYAPKDRTLRAYSFSAVKNTVTPILDPRSQEVIKNWEARVGKEEADRIRNEAISAGNIGHSMLEKWNAGKPLGVYPMNMAGYVQALENQILPYLQKSSEPIAVVDDAGDWVTLSEVFVVDFERQFLGRLDLVVEIAAAPFTGKRVLLELKGSLKEKSIEHMRGNIIQAVAYLATFNEIAALCPEQMEPLDGMAMAYMYSSGNGQVIPILGEEIQEYADEWQQWLGCFHNILEDHCAA